MQKCLIISNTSKTQSRELSQVISLFLRDRGVDADIYNFDGTFNNSAFKGYDFVITLGGDGTVLFAARGCVKNEIPVFSVNLGEFGFIASVQIDEWKSELEKFLAGNATIDTRMMLNVAIVSSIYNNAFSGIGLNDVVISSKTAARTIIFEVFYNDIPLGTFKSDGVIISTPTGSTAYSASAGGPIIESDVDALLLTPINSFSLSARPLVLGSKGEIGVKILSSRNTQVIITVDGQKSFDLAPGDFLKVRKLPQRVKLISATQKKFYNALRTKLNWSGGPHI